VCWYWFIHDGSRKRLWAIPCGHTRASLPLGRKARCCMSLSRSSLFLRNSSRIYTLASWRVLIVSMSCCSVGASTPPGPTDIGCGYTGCVGCVSCSGCAADTGSVVCATCVIFAFRILLKNFEHKCGWDQVLSGPTVGPKCSCR